MSTLNLNANINGAKRGLPYPTADLLFKSGNFDFENNLLLDTSGNENNVSLIGGNCINIINDITITLNIPKIGATISEVNFSETTTGITINVSGHIEIDKSELLNSKIYQIKLSTEDELFFTGGSSFYGFASSTLFGVLGGEVDVDWEWSTQNVYFRNLQNGFSKSSLLYNICTEDMTEFLKRNFTTPNENTISYVGNNYTYDSYVRYTAPLSKTGIYKTKITVWDSTENFGNTDFKCSYFSATLYKDDDGEYLYKNGTHYITSAYPGTVPYINFEMNDDGGSDWTGKNMKFKVEWVKCVDTNVLIPAYDETYDMFGDKISNIFTQGYLNGCEVQLDFSGISGITNYAGNPLTLPSDYAYGDTCSNPSFKRIKYDDNLKAIEGNYLIYSSFQTGNNLSKILTYIESPNMLAKMVNDHEVWIVKKFNSTKDQLFVFGYQGANLNISLQSISLLDNSGLLPIIPTETDPYIGLFETNDQVGPYSISGISWAGGGHLAPNNETIQSDWAEIIAKSDENDTITLDDSSEFPIPTDKIRCVNIKYWNGSEYSVLTRGKYEKTGDILSLFGITSDGNFDLSSVVIGGDHPSQAEYAYQTSETGALDLIGLDEWTAIEEIKYTVINNIIDYTTANKETLEADHIIQEIITYTLNQKSSTVFINYISELLKDLTIQAYYGLQSTGFGSGTNPKYYLAHSDDLTLQATFEGLNSGNRSTYLCEKVIGMDDAVTPDMTKNLSSFINLNYGTPSEDKDTNPYFTYSNSKFYFRNILNKEYLEGDFVRWKGGFNAFKNETTTFGVFAYLQQEDNILYFIVDFTDELTYSPSINETFLFLSGRNCQLIYKDSSITIDGISDIIFTTPNSGLSLTATASGNIKLKLI